MNQLTTEQRQGIAGSAKDNQEGIDLFEMLEARYGRDAACGMGVRPIKRPVTIRLDEDVLDWLKGYGPGYQTRLNFLLRHAMMGGARERG
jgi:uncharacterized protein (DUF4415 family)